MNTECTDTECMICFVPMGNDPWNKHQMAGCSHTICVDCAMKIQSMSDKSSETNTISSESETSETIRDEEYEEVEYDEYDGVSYDEYDGVRMRGQIHTMVPRRLEPEFDDVFHTQEFDINPPMDYTMKYSTDGCTITRLNYYVLEGRPNPFKCPYCRKPEPNIYDFDALRYCIQSKTLEWNILEGKFYKDNLSSFTMSKEGATFAYKLSKDESRLHVMWTEVTTYPFADSYEQIHNYSDINKMPKKQKDARAYTRPKRYTKMIR